MFTKIQCSFIVIRDFGNLTLIVRNFQKNQSITNRIPKLTETTFPKFTGSKGYLLFQKRFRKFRIPIILRST